MNRNTSIILITALTLGTTWAIRGQFGHEQGAAWAGGIACLVLIYASGRKDWVQNSLKSALLGAIGWGMGGMMSYGVVVGYGRSEIWHNSAYGLVMLGVIGGLYGLIGGGLMGLGVEEAQSGKKVAWAQLFVEMTAGGIVFYYFVVEQLGLLMTPPRSEAWGICAGAGIALLYFLQRNGYRGALRTALFSGIGGGFGFAFGNFLQVLGYLSEIRFNFWNVMEYSLGFFGGLGMSYGLLTGFPSTSPVLEKSKNFNPRISWSLMGLVFLIPLIVFQQSFVAKDLVENFSNRGVEQAGFWASTSIFLALGLWVVLQVSTYFSYRALVNKQLTLKSLIFLVAFGLFACYMLYSWLITGAFLSLESVEQYLYLLNFGVVFVWITRLPDHPEIGLLPDFSWKRLSIWVVLLLLVLAWIASLLHGPIPGAQERF